MSARIDSILMDPSGDAINAERRRAPRVKTNSFHPMRNASRFAALFGAPPKTIRQEPRGLLLIAERNRALTISTKESCAAVPLIAIGGNLFLREIITRVASVGSEVDDFRLTMLNPTRNIPNSVTTWTTGRLCALSATRKPTPTDGLSIGTSARTNRAAKRLSQEVFHFE